MMMVTKRQYDSITLQAIYDAERASLDLTERVVAVMIEKKLTRSDLAKVLGSTKDYITQLLDGPNFTFESAAKLALSVGLRFRVVCDDETPESQIPTT